MKLLLDEHISPAVARGLSAAHGELAVAALREWQAGAWLEASDALLLQAAAADGWTLVTYDLRTIPPLLKEWGEQGIAHGGVILVDEQRSIAPSDFGGLIRALERLASALGDADWRDRVAFLTR